MELIWNGKYDKGRKVAPLKIALPFQTVETVNESAQDRARSKPKAEPNASREYTLEESVAGITDENRHTEIDWGRPMGNEAW
jgi:antitoxin component of MazEF toxin-antitoxin module